MFLLDTDFCIDWLRRKDYARKAMAAVSPADVALSAVTVGELLMGAFCAVLASTEMEKVKAFVAPIRILPFGEQEAFHFAGIASRLRKDGQSIGAQDAMIAATAAAHRLTIITNNTRHFGRVLGVESKSWKPKKV
jgi:tRNA(fMet)-specific endonuclease VapC